MADEIPVIDAEGGREILVAGLTDNEFSRQVQGYLTVESRSEILGGLLPRDKLPGKGFDPLPNYESGGEIQDFLPNVEYAEDLGGLHIIAHNELAGEFR